MLNKTNIFYLAVTQYKIMLLCSVPMGNWKMGALAGFVFSSFHPTWTIKLPSGKALCFQIYRWKVTASATLDNFSSGNNQMQTGMKAISQFLCRTQVGWRLPNAAWKPGYNEVLMDLATIDIHFLYCTWLKVALDNDFVLLLIPATHH